MTPDRRPRRSQERLDDYERRFKWPLLTVSLLYLLLVLYEMLPRVRITATLTAVDIAFWLIFVADYGWRVFRIAPDPRRYWHQRLCLLDLFVIVSFPVLLLFNVLLSINGTVLGSIVRMIAQGFRLARVAAQGGRVMGQAQRIFSRRALRVLIPVAALIAGYAVIYVWLAEAAHRGAAIHGPGDSAWWAVFTLMTASYGDLYPHGAGGRIAAVVLMGVGLIITGWLTAALASWFVVQDDESVDRRVDRKLDELSERLAKLDEMLKRMAAMEAHLEALRGAPPGGAVERPGVPDGVE